MSEEYLNHLYNSQTLNHVNNFNFAPSSTTSQINQTQNSQHKILLKQSSNEQMTADEQSAKQRLKLSSEEMQLLIKDRQRKDNHNMSKTIHSVQSY
jgi:hypothetical protein